MPSPSPVAAVPAEFVPHLGPLEGVEVLAYDGHDATTVPGGGREVDVLVLPFYGRPWLKRMGEVPGVRAVVLASAGYEHALPFVPEGVQLANAVGVHDTPTAEMALTLILAAQRAIPDYVRAQGEGRWDTTAIGQRRALADSRVVILGYGGIGRALARRLLACEAEVVAVASRARAGDEYVDAVHGIEELPSLLADAHVLVVAVPLSERTRGLVDADVLAALPDDALVVNVARGPVVDTEALLAECGSGRLRAAVDVTDPEPLPDGHPFFSTPGVLVSPHVGGGTPAAYPRMGAYVSRQLTAYRDHGRLDHVVAEG
ncbi:2-hydroxyacid dehydrogenase [Ornithinimicrobium tianjinense]|uniref:Dehydrogenase n=1 Tax=Ornithinimicrobium tianjinense TaxID=1195761 RepID=A0A917BJ53_9MICO|nr:2-hydroxyacid dehydrogenase [Ornithinimicrobium tianjinense]GGF41685.1 dehydrogenase [Ornithinimicrobium tianjinense]